MALTSLIAAIVRFVLQAMSLFAFIGFLALGITFAIAAPWLKVPLFYKFLLPSLYGVLAWQVRPFQDMNPSWKLIALKMSAAKWAGFCTILLSLSAYLAIATIIVSGSILFAADVSSVSVGRFRFIVLLAPALLQLCKPQRLVKNLDAYSKISSVIGHLMGFVLKDLRFFKSRRTRRLIKRGRMTNFWIVILVTVLTSGFYLIASNLDYENSLADRRGNDDITVSSQRYYAEITEKVRKELRLLNWSIPEKPIQVDFQLSQIGSVDLARNSILLGGTISAYYSDDSISSPYGVGMLTKKATEDPLSIASLNFLPGTDSKFEPLAQRAQRSRGAIPGHYYSLYSFSGEFPLKSKLENFPYDSYQWTIKLKMPITAASMRLEPIAVDLAEAENFEMNGVSFQPSVCENGSTGNSNKYVCAKAYVEDFYGDEGGISGKPVIEESGYLVRDASSGFFRYIFPMIVSILILTTVDLLRGDGVKELRLATPPSIFLALAFMQSSYQALVRQASYLTFLDQLYIASYVLCLIALAKAVLDYSSPRVLNSNRGRGSSSLRLMLSEAYIYVFLIAPFLAWPG